MPCKWNPAMCGKKRWNTGLVSLIFAVLLLWSHNMPANEPESCAVRGLPNVPLTLDRLIEYALANNPDIAIAGQEVLAAEARYDQAAGARLPDLSVRGSYNHHLDEQKLLPIGEPGSPIILSRNLAAADIVLAIPIFTGGRLRNKMSAAKLLQESEEHRLSRSREELVFYVANYFYLILYQQRAIDSVEYSQEALTEHLARVKSLVEMRKAAPVDRSRIEVAVADLEETLLQEKNTMAILQRALFSLLGVREYDGPLLLEGHLVIDAPMALPDVETAFRTASTERGDYLSLQAEVRSLEHSVKAAKAERRPSINLYGAYGDRWALGKTWGLGEKRRDVGQIGVNVVIPIFNGGIANAGIREEKAKLSAGRERLRKVGLQIRQEVETALLSAQSALKRIEVTQSTVDLARENLEIERKKYELGKGVVVDVLDSQAALLASETSYYRALADYHISCAMLRLATGERTQ